MPHPAELLGPGGPFSELLLSFESRQDQQDMAEQVYQTLTQSQTLLCEAGTGTGKSFAYLVPAFLAEGKVIVSTGTKHLQDQLLEKDVPLVKKALSITKQVTVLKGRSNYLCLHFYFKYLMDQPLFKERSKELEVIEAWRKRTLSGDLAEITGVDESSPVKKYLVSTKENCLGSDCDHHEECYVYAARRRAHKADIVIVNHHLLLSHLKMQHDNDADILPEAQGVIVDEAHLLPEIAVHFQCKTLSSYALSELAQALHQQCRQLFFEDQTLEAFSSKLADWAMSVQSELKEQGFLQRSLPISTELVQRLQTLRDMVETALEHAQAFREDHLEIEPYLQQLDYVQEVLRCFDPKIAGEYYCWYECYARSFVLKALPCDVGRVWEDIYQNNPMAWIFMSATLRVAESFEYFAQRVGLQHYESATFESPFDYPNQVLSYLPQTLPDPNAPGFLDALIETIVPVIKLVKGRTFILFTSLETMEACHERLKSEIDYPLLLQGEDARSRLLERFRNAGNAVLLGANSFWEGVDIKGAALSCVIIVKLPFASPSDPLVDIQIRQVKMRGGNPFRDYQLPQAITLFRQGVGRLIRGRDDRGVIMLCDNRLRNRSYGKNFMSGLNKAPVTDNLDDLAHFVNDI